jgi:hypothetical protein
LEIPSGVFLDIPELREYFSDTIPYASTKVSKKLAKWLQMHSSATVDEIFSMLKSSAKQNADQANPKLIALLYQFINERWKDEFKEEFKKHPLILVSKPTPLWLNSKDVIWPDRREVFGSSYAYLESEYPKLRNFFVENVGVTSEIDERAYSKAWLNLQSQKPSEPKQVEEALEKIYPVILKIAKSERRPSWWKEFSGQALIWTQSNRFVKSSQAYIPDDGDFKKLLGGLVEYTWLPVKDSYAEFEPLYFSLGVKSLAASVIITSGSQQTTQHPASYQQYIRPLVKKAICAYLQEKHREQYNFLKNKGEIETLLLTREYLLNHLQINIEIDGFRKVVDHGLGYWDSSTKSLYLSESSDTKDLLIEIPSIIARRLLSGQSARGLEDFIGRMISISDEQIPVILNKRAIYLSKDEQSWIDQILVIEPTPSLNPLVVGIHDQNEKSVVSNNDTKNIEDDLITGSPGQEDQRSNNERGNNRRTDVTGGGRNQGRSASTHSSAIGEPQQSKSRTIVYTEKEQNSDPEADERDNPFSELNINGMAKVLSYEKQRGRDPEDKNKIQPNFPGYDIESKINGQVERYIEVKSTKITWGAKGVWMTKAQFQKALELKDLYWLYIVEHATSEQSRLIMIQDPARKTDYFAFDNGWEDIGKKEYLDLSSADFSY